MKRVVIVVWLALGQLLFWLGWPVLYTFFHNSSRVRVILRHNNEILLVQPWYSAGQWQIPGGGVKQVETHIQAALREVKEETGISLQANQLHQLGRPVQVREKYIPFRATLYAAELSKKPLVKTAQLEIVSSRWMNLDNINMLSLQQSSLQALGRLEKQ